MTEEPQVHPKVRQEVGVPLAAVTDQTVGEIQQQLHGKPNAVSPLTFKGPRQAYINPMACIADNDMMCL